VKKKLKLATKGIKQLTSITELEFLSERMILAKFVRGPLVRIVIFSLGSSCSLIACQTSKANGCRSSGWSVFLGAPCFTEFSAVYLRMESRKL
jgi:hypothetical protein